jgi:hypothetical protein
MRERNYWPHFILALVAFAVVLGVWTIKVALDNPVELDNSYMVHYRDLDENFYKIEQARRAFDKSYRVELLNKKLKQEETIRLRVTDLNGTPVPDATVELLITRPDTTRHDIKTIARYQNGLYEANISFPLEGRWNIVVLTKIDESRYRYDIYKRSTRKAMDEKLK